MGEDTDFKCLKRLMVAAEGSTLYSTLGNLLKDQRGTETILKGERLIVIKMG